MQKQFTREDIIEAARRAGFSNMDSINIILDMAEMRPAMRWYDVEERLPDEGVTVWGMNSEGQVFLCAYKNVVNEGMVWAVMDDSPFAVDGKIHIIAIWDDDYNIIKWHPVPELP